MTKSNASRKSNAAKAAKSATNATASMKQNVAPTAKAVEPTPLEALSAKAEKAAKALEASKEAYQSASVTLQSDKFKSERLAIEVINLKHQQGINLKVEEEAIWALNRVEVFAQQSGLNQLGELVASKFKELADSLKAAKKASRSLNAAVRNLLADWEVFEPIFKSVGLEKDAINASLLKEATPFLTLPTGEGIKVAELTRRVKRDGNGNPLKVDGKKQYDSALKPIVDWDAIKFATIVVTIELAKGLFSAEAEEKHSKFLAEAETALKAVADAKAAAEAEKEAAKKAAADAKASKVAEEAASKEAEAKAHEAAAKAANEAAKKAAPAAKAAKKATDNAAKAAAKKVAPAAKAAKKVVNA